MDYISRWVIGCFLWAIFAGSASAASLFDFKTDKSASVWYGNNRGCEGGCMLGYQFHLASSVTIDGLGLFDADGNGLTSAHDVGLWSTSGTLLASTVVGPGSGESTPSASGVGAFVFAKISQQTLNLGAGDYVLGAFYGPGSKDRVVYSASGIFSNSPNASFGAVHWQVTSAFERPTKFNPKYVDRYFGPNARIAPIRETSAVPIPAAAWLLGSAVLGLAGLGRRKLMPT